MENLDVAYHRINLKGDKIPVSWEEENQLRRDILWCFDENGPELFNPYTYPLELKYWEYLNLIGDRQAVETEFYQKGILVILIFKIIEFNDTEGMYQDIFGENSREEIRDYIKMLESNNPDLLRLKNVALEEMTTVCSVTEEDIRETRAFGKNHGKPFSKDFGKFSNEVRWMGENVIKAYFKNHFNL